jgi:hypothetical protein
LLYFRVTRREREKGALPGALRAAAITAAQERAASRTDTTVDPTYFYQVKDTPFGGALPLSLNYMRALNDGAAFYRVFVQNASLGFVLQDVSWTDEHWNGFEFVPITTGPRNVGGQPGFFPTRALSDLF